jgi:uncharacterized membrane protein YccC
MSSKFGLPAALFSLKCFVAAMLALWISLRIGLPRPYWAVTTAYIVAQPLAGAVLSKAVFRVIGTLVGAAAAVLLVGNLVNAPELLTLALAGWLGLCVFVSLLDRTPRAYMFVLAGYSACIVGLPSVDTPSLIFTTASLRVQEICIGILCGSLVHGVVFPGSVAAVLLARVDAMLGDAERWSRDSLAGHPVPGLDADRRRLAQDITELHQLSVHLPFETARVSPRVRTVRALQDQLSLLLPLAAAVDDRMEALVRNGNPLPPAVILLIENVKFWLKDLGADPAAREATADGLRSRCSALEPQVGPATDWHELLLLSLLSRLSDLIAAHADCRTLEDQMHSPSPWALTPRVRVLLDDDRTRKLHRDFASATRGAFGAALTLVLACALWIGSGWKDGATAAMLAGVFLALFSSSPDPMAPLKGFGIGTIIATVLSAIYGFAILPRIDGFPMLAAVLAPVLLIGGSLMASPRYAVIALAAMLGLANPSLLAARYDSEFASYINGSLAQIVGIAFALVMTRLLQSAGAESAIRRIMRAGWMDIASRSLSTAAPDVRGWMNRMLDRIALMGPRLAGRGQQGEIPVFDALRDMRTGIVIGELRQLRMDLPPEDSAPLVPVLGDVGAYYRNLDFERLHVPSSALLDHIDAAMQHLAGHPSSAIRRASLLSLVSLRRNLFRGADAYAAASI